MSDKLNEMDGKLDVLQNGVDALQQDMRRLVGQPVREVFAEKRGQLLRRHSTLREKVYIPNDGVRAGADGKFLITEENKAFDLLDGVDGFLQDSGKSLLLLSGPAGSGKSTFL